MPIEYSHGTHAVVNLTAPEEKCKFPGADLCRVDTSRDRSWFARAYYQYRIADLLFPGHFIKVVGASTNLKTNDLRTEPTFFLDAMVSPKYFQRGNRLYSVMASVPKEHSVYSTHMKWSDRFQSKTLTCPCPECQSHHEFHQRLNLEDQAARLTGLTCAVGIDLPEEDPSDYCLSLEGKILFFEIKAFYPLSIEQHLTNLSHPTPTESFAFQLLRRYKLLRDQAYRDMQQKLAEFRG